ncbi:Uncharacterized protein TCM_008666, partial [Theobroma cacao]
SPYLSLLFSSIFLCWFFYLLAPLQKSSPMENLPFTLAADYPKPHLLAGLFIIGSLSFSFSLPYHLHTLQIHHKSEPTFVGHCQVLNFLFFFVFFLYFVFECLVCYCGCASSLRLEMGFDMRADIHFSL